MTLYHFKSDLLICALFEAYNHFQREIARMLKVSRNTVRDVFDAADAAGVYWNTAYNLSESQINELLFPSPHRCPPD